MLVKETVIFTSECSFQNDLTFTQYFLRQSSIILWFVFCFFFFSKGKKRKRGRSIDSIEIESPKIAKKRISNKTEEEDSASLLKSLGISVMSEACDSIINQDKE